MKVGPNHSEQLKNNRTADVGHNAQGEDTKIAQVHHR